AILEPRDCRLVVIGLGPRDFLSLLRVFGAATGCAGPAFDRDWHLCLSWRLAPAEDCGCRGSLSGSAGSDARTAARGVKSATGPAAPDHARPSRPARASLSDRSSQMIHFPAFDEFCSLARDFDLVPIYRQLTGDTLTPVSAFCKIQQDDWSFLFESVVGGERLGRYSFLGSGPFLRLQARDQRVSIERLNPARPSGSWKREELTAPDPLKTLESELNRARAPHVSGLPRFSGGAVGYAGYDTVRYTERLLHPPPDDRDLPDLC